MMSENTVLLRSESSNGSARRMIMPMSAKFDGYRAQAFKGVLQQE
jgi:hypothetical protein